MSNIKKSKNTQSEPEGYYPNLKACATANGVDLATLKLAKSMNCPGFPDRGGIDWTKAAPWIEANAEKLKDVEKESKAYWDLQKTKYQAGRSRIAYENDAGLYFLKSDVLAGLKAIGEQQKAMLLNKLRNELPVKTEGLSVAAKMDLGEAVAMEIYAIFRTGISKWTESKPN